jgi:hypothetical protein
MSRVRDQFRIGFETGVKCKGIIQTPYRWAVSTETTLVNYLFVIWVNCAGGLCRLFHLQVSSGDVFFSLIGTEREGGKVGRADFVEVVGSPTPPIQTKDTLPFPSPFKIYFKLRIR